MADKELTDIELSQLAYERSNASLKDYNPHELADEDKVREEDRTSELPKEPVILTADNTTGANTKPSSTSSTSSTSK